MERLWDTDFEYWSSKYRAAVGVASWSVISYAGLFITTIMSDPCSSLRSWIACTYVLQTFSLFIKTYHAVSMVRTSYEYSRDSAVSIITGCYCFELVYKGVLGMIILVSGTTCSGPWTILLWAYTMEGVLFIILCAFLAGWWLGRTLLSFLTP